MKKQKANKTKRNDPCPCGSGRKYKKCCLGKTTAVKDEPDTIYARRYGIQLKNASDIAAIRKAGKLVLDTLNMVEDRLRPGIRTEEINDWVQNL